MALYICKCGRQVTKSSTADNTGNRDTADCTGCPYLLPWGPDKYVEGLGFRKEIQGYECRMSPTISYTTSYRGQANDKCTLHILSLDLDFLDTVQAWIYDHAADTLTAGFSRGSMRGTDFSNKGRYSLSISCAQNKKGMAAKAALIERFFTGGRVRKDMTLAQEKAHILSAIQRGREQAQRKDQPMKKQNDRCPLQQECERTCKVIGHERDCDYYVNNRYSTGGIPDQDEILDDEEATRLEEIEKGSPSDLSLAPSEPVIYQNDYGTLFAVREDNGAPALMCKPLASDAWTLSGVLAAVQGEAYTAEDLQEVLDEYARAHGWKPVVAPASAEPPLPMPGDVYQAPQSGQLYKIGELTNGKKTCYLTMRSNAQGSTWVPANSSVYPNLSDAQGEFEAWIRTEQLEPVAPTGASAATTDTSAAPQPSQAAGTSTGSPGNSADASSCPSAEPAPQAPAALPLSAPDTAPMNLPAFDYTGLDADTAEKLRGITDRVMELSQTYAWGMAYQVGRAHDLLCGDGACETVSQAHKRNNQHSENTFTAWCAYIGVERRSAYNLLNAYRLICKATPEQQRNLQLAPAKLLYEAGKKDVPGQLADAVMNGDITKTKQFLDARREWQAKLDAEHAAREQAEQQRDKAVTHIQAARDMQIDTARERDAALRRAAEAENRAAGAQKLADQRGDENTALKAQIRDLESRPVEVAVAQPGEEQIEAWRKEGENRAAAALQDRLRKADQAKADAQRQVNALQTELAAARPDADACQRTADTLYETAENLRILLRTQLKQAQLSPTDYGKVVAHVLQVARTLLDTVRVCAPDGYDIDSEEDDDFE